MEREFLQLAVWDQFTAAEAETVARALERCLSGRWSFDAVEEHACGDQRRHVAFFRRDGGRFALIPGGDILLGYDPDRRWTPPADLPGGWEGEFGFDVEAYLKGLTPLRTVTPEPFLIETIAQKVPPGATYRRLTALAASEGLRLPTADEWEHACAAGSRTLWRWGDACPNDYMPYFDREPHRVHMRPNAFGLTIAYDPYRWEPVAEAGEARGGDGGSVICGGAGFMAAWEVLASSYRASYARQRDPGGGPEDARMYNGCLRRACSLPPGCLD
jgi:hypothetical protein